MSISDINSMSITERMYLMEQLWDSFKQDKDKLDSPVWHKGILEERKRRYENGELRTVSLDELKTSFNR